MNNIESEIWTKTNRKAMDFLVRQIHTGDNSAFQAGRLYGCCEALCMAGVITADQWGELQAQLTPATNAVKIE